MGGPGGRSSYKQHKRLQAAFATAVMGIHGVAQTDKDLKPTSLKNIIAAVVRAFKLHDAQVMGHEISDLEEILAGLQPSPEIVHGLAEILGANEGR